LRAISGMEGLFRQASRDLVDGNERYIWPVTSYNFRDPGQTLILSNSNMLPGSVINYLD
jgi:hypothetical protein